MNIKISRKKWKHRKARGFPMLPLVSQKRQNIITVSKVNKALNSYLRSPARHTIVRGLTSISELNSSDLQTCQDFEHKYQGTSWCVTALTKLSLFFRDFA